MLLSEIVVFKCLQIKNGFAGRKIDLFGMAFYHRDIVHVFYVDYCLSHSAFLLVFVTDFVL